MHLYCNHSFRTGPSINIKIFTHATHAHTCTCSDVVVGIGNIYIVSEKSWSGRNTLGPSAHHKCFIYLKIILYVCAHTRPVGVCCVVFGINKCTWEWDLKCVLRQNDVHNSQNVTASVRKPEHFRFDMDQCTLCSDATHLKAPTHAHRF